MANPLFICVNALHLYIDNVRIIKVSYVKFRCQIYNLMKRETGVNPVRTRHRN